MFRSWNRNNTRNRLLLLVGALMIGGCAGASVNPGVNSQPASSGRLSTIYVYPLAVSSQDVTLNQGFFQKTYRNISDSNQEVDPIIATTISGS